MDSTNKDKHEKKDDNQEKEKEFFHPVTKEKISKR